MKTIPASELKDTLERTVIVDVRTPAEYEEVHIPGARLIPLHEFDEAKAAALKEAGSTVCLVCRSGNRAKQAAERFVAAGHEDFTILEGGMGAWDAAGFPVNRGKATISVERQVRIAAGSLVLLGVVLGFVAHPAFFGLSAFVGAGLVFAGVTDWCGMGLLMARMPWNNRSSKSCCSVPE